MKLLRRNIILVCLQLSGMMLIAQSKPVTVSIDLSLARDSSFRQDSFWLAIFSDLVPSYIELPDQNIVGEKTGEDKYSFQLLNNAGKQPFYFSILTYDARGNRREILNKYIIEPREDFTIRFIPAPGIWSLGHGKFTRQFFGEAVDELICQEMMHVASYNDGGSIKLPWQETRISRMQKVLNGYKPFIKPEIFNVLSLDIIGEFRSKSYEEMIRRWRINPASRDSLLKVFNRYVAEDNRIIATPQAKMISKYYSFLEVIRELCRISLTAPRKTDQLLALYGSLKKQAAPVRDKLLAQYFARYGISIASRAGYLDSLVRDASVLAKTEPYSAMIASYTTMTPGKKAFPFTLPDPSGKLVSLSDFSGKKVMIDFWFTGCTACIKFYKNVLQDIKAKYHGDTSIVFITINMDRSRDVWLKSMQSGQYTSEEGINLYTDGKGFDHPLIRYYSINAAPQPLLIDQRGIISATNRLSLSKEALEEEIEKLSK